MEIIKIAALGIIGVLLAVQFKSYKSEYGVYLGLGVSIVLFFYALKSLQSVIAQFEVLGKYMDMGQGYLAIVFKVLGITYICEFSAGICKDAGYKSIAGQIEMLGRLTVMFSGLPIILAIIEQLEGIL